MTDDLPLGWNTASLGQLASLERGKFSARPRNDPKYYGGAYPFIQTGDVRNSRGVIRRYSQTLNDAGLKVSRLFPAGTLLITIAANIGDLGVTTFASAAPDSLVAIRPSAAVSQRWLHHALTAQKLVLESIATQNAQANLNLEKLRPFPLRVPPLKEQVAIAQALDDVSGLVAMLRVVITKKQAIKQGMIQQLLTGRTRLPGFDSGWHETSLRTVATGLRGSGLSKEDVDPGGSNPCLLYGELFTTYGRRIDQVKSRTNALTSVCSQEGDVLVPGSTTTVARDLATASAIRAPGVLIGGDTNIVRPGSSLDPEWLAYYITHQLGSRIAEVAQGLTIKHLYVRDLLECSITLPPIVEQEAIVGALTDAEAEIDALRRRLDKARELKTGMMQQLLRA